MASCSLVFCLAAGASSGYNLETSWDLQGASVFEQRGGRQLLDTVSYTTNVIDANYDAYPSDFHQQRRIQQVSSYHYNPYDEDLRQYEAMLAAMHHEDRSSSGRRLRQLAPAPAAGSAGGTTSGNAGQAQAPSAHGKDSLLPFRAFASDKHTGLQAAHVLLHFLSAVYLEGPPACCNYCFPSSAQHGCLCTSC